MGVSVPHMGLYPLQSIDCTVTVLSDLFSWSVNDAITNYNGLSDLKNKCFSHSGKYQIKAWTLGRQENWQTKQNTACPWIILTLREENQ